MNRRRFLQAAGVTGVGVALAGCNDLLPKRNRTPTPERTDAPTSTPTPATTPEPLLEDPTLRERFETVVNVGASSRFRRGESSIVPLLAEHAGDDTALYFPHGTYLMDDAVDIHEFSNLGIIGDGATIVLPDGYDGALFNIGQEDDASDFLMQEIEFDMRAPDTGARVLNVRAGGDVQIRDLSVIGKRDAGSDALIRIDVPDPDGVARVERLSLPNGSTHKTSAAGCYIGDTHRGAARFVDCHINGFADNGLYASPNRGSVVVEGGIYANCDVGSIRVGDNSVIRGAYVRCDSAPEGFNNMRGIRVREGSNVLIEDCSIDMFRVKNSGGAIVMAKWLESATIRNTRIRVDTDGVPAILVRDPNKGISRDEPIRIQDVTITGTAADEHAVEVEKRNNCAFDHVYIRQTGENRNGFFFDDCQDVHVRNTVIDVTGLPIVTEADSTVIQDNVKIPGRAELPAGYRPFGTERRGY